MPLQGTIYNRLITKTTKGTTRRDIEKHSALGTGSAICPSSQDRAKQETGWELVRSLHNDWQN